MEKGTWVRDALIADGTFVSLNENPLVTYKLNRTSFSFLIGGKLTASIHFAALYMESFRFHWDFFVSSSMFSGCISETFLLLHIEKDT
jgi:hypothetical protein